MMQGQWRTGVLFLMGAALALQGVFAAPRNAVENPFAECDRMLNEAQRSSANVPGAGAYLNQARQLLNQAKSDYYNLNESLSASGTSPGSVQTLGAGGKTSLGKMTPRTFDSAGLAARTEAWSKQMNQMLGKIKNMSTGDLKTSQEVDDMFKMMGGQEPRKEPAAAETAPKTLGGQAQKEIERLGGKPSKDSSAMVVPLLRNPNLDPAVDGGSSEHMQIQKVLSDSKYAHMSPRELDSLAAQYPDNPEIQQTIKSLKAQNESRDNLGAISERVATTEEEMKSETAKGNREALRATAIAGDLTLGVPQGWDEYVAGEKTIPRVLGDIGVSKVEDGIDAKVVKEAELFAETEGWKSGVKDALNSDVKLSDLKVPGSDMPVTGEKVFGVKIPDAGLERAVGGMGGLVDGISAIPDLIDFKNAVDKGGDHYVNAAEKSSELNAGGGTGQAVDHWNDMRQKSLRSSAELSRLLDAQPVPPQPDPIPADPYQPGPPPPLP